MRLSQLYFVILIFNRVRLERVVIRLRVMTAYGRFEMGEAPTTDRWSRTLGGYTMFLAGAASAEFGTPSESIAEGGTVSSHRMKNLITLRSRERDWNADVDVRNV